MSTGTSKSKDFVQPIVESILDEAMSRVDGPNQQNEEGMVTFRNVMFFLLISNWFFVFSSNYS